MRVEITGIETYQVWGGKRNLLFVVVDTDEGIHGVGEAGLTGRELAVTGTIEHFEPLLIGEDPFRSEHLWQLLFRGGFFPARHAVSAAISAVDVALWDIKGKALGVPVYELLGGRARDRVVCYPHNEEAGTDTSALVESCLKTKEEGWRFVRWGLPQEGEVFEPRRSLFAAIDQLTAVREAVGEEVEMILDVHTRLDMPDSLWLCREAEPLRPYFIEDPLRSEDPGSYEMMRLRTSVPLAAGEQFGSKWEFRELVEKEWIDRRHLRDPPRKARRPQSARTGLDGRLFALEPLVPQLRRPGATLQTRNISDRRRACTARVGGWPPAATHAPGVGCGVRSGGCEGSSLPDGGASSLAPVGRFGHELVSDPVS
jgi:L-alanine-DL-glutamate epimerase-like enolase superfamily enzyme